MNPAPPDDCFAHDKDRLSHDEALALLKDGVTPAAETENVALAGAAGRILAEEITAPRPVPAHDNSAMDGYAFAHKEYAASNDGWMPVAGRAAAGHPFAGPVPQGAAIRIFTGAMMAQGTDTVAMQENTKTQTRDGKPWVHIPAGLKPGANRRLAGEDTAEGAVLLSTGVRLRPQEIATVASTGRGSAPCYRPLKAAVFSTGDEIIRAGDAFQPGLVYDANAPMLFALLQGLPLEVFDLGVLPDDRDQVSERLEAAGQEYDVLLTSGGASRGEEDHVAAAIEALGTRHLWHLSIKPGKPLVFGRIGKASIIGLPGNPVAVMVCFLLYARPVLMAMAGASWPEPRRYPLPAGFSMNKKPGRREFQRGILDAGAGGTLRVRKYPRDGSGLIASLREADGLIEIGEDVTAIAEGDAVSFIPFAEFGIARS